MCGRTFTIDRTDCCSGGSTEISSSAVQEFRKLLEINRGSGPYEAEVSEPLVSINKCKAYALDLLKDPAAIALWRPAVFSLGVFAEGSNDTKILSALLTLQTSSPQVGNNVLLLDRAQTETIGAIERVVAASARGNLIVDQQSRPRNPLRTALACFSFPADVERGTEYRKR